MSLFAYLGPVFVLSAMLAASAAFEAHADRWPLLLQILVAVLSLICASHLVLSLVNWLATLLVHPSLLPRLDFSHGNSRGGPHPGRRTHDPGERRRRWRSSARRWRCASWPTATTGSTSACSPTSDDAKEEHEPDDAVVLELVTARIGELNARYPREEGDAFFLFHRPRRWNPRERCWMGHERKRGKLSDLNELLRHGTPGRSR